MNIKLTKHWHFAVALISWLVLNPIILNLGSGVAGTLGRGISAGIMGGLFFILIIMWISFATKKKDVGNRQ